MAIRVGISGGIAGDAVRRMQSDILKAQKAAIAGATEYAKQSIRDAIRAYSSSPRLPNIVGSEVYPKGARLAYRPAGEVFARGEQAARILRQMEAGTPITARNRRFLAVPLHNQRRGGGRGRLATPREIPGLFFVPARRAGSGGYVGLLALRQESGLRGGRGRTERGRQLRASAKADAGRGVVPMFALFRQVRGRKVFDQEKVVRDAMDKIPGLLDRSFAQLQAGRAPAAVAA